MQDFYKLKKYSEKNQKTVYDIAIKFGGSITVSDIYSNTNLSMDEIEFILADLSSKNFVNSKIDEKTSVIHYIFPDIHNSDNKSLITSTGIDKLILRIKYGVNSDNKPVEFLEKAILQTAQECNGILGISKIVEYTGLNIDDAQDVISLLCTKNICKMEINQDTREIEYHFPEIINKINPIEDLENNFIKDISKKALSRIRKNTDRMLIKSKVSKYKTQYKTSVFLDTFSGGLGHMIDKRWNINDLLIFSLLPAIISAGLSYIPLIAFLRFQDAEFYSISERDKHKKLKEINKKSLIYVLIFSLLYYKFIGLEGLNNYYIFLISIIGF
ncbi:MAG: hypothetical protein U0354_06820 [Candidatus Sericytochromatia bacterium]